MKTVRAGRLRRRLAFEILVTEQDSDGAHIEDWMPAFEVGHVMPAEVTPFSSREFFAAAAVQSKATHRIKVRFRPNFIHQSYKMRATERGIVYNIEGEIPDPDSGVRYLTLLASSGVSPGN